MYNIHQVIEKVIFLDVETVCMTPSYAELPERMKPLWDKKASKFQNPEKSLNVEDLFFEKAAIQAEFGKIICISCGYLILEEGKMVMKTKSFYGHDEYILLNDFAEMVNTFFAKDVQVKKFCTHNGKEFDIPYICRRMLINRVKLPKLLDIAGKKTWNVDFILDTQDLWRFGDMKAFTSLDLLSAVFGIPSPKDDIEGSEVSRVYWVENNLERIKTYCEKDVKTTAQVFLAMNQLPLLPKEEA
ncbi:MAG: ribonuclease H-like domain-containing protein [Bacteroidia bacterium]|nr:ribonuclease H-like domain-containing protein [Bacteroidia bacterium]